MGVVVVGEVVLVVAAASDFEINALIEGTGSEYLAQYGSLFTVIVPVGGKGVTYKQVEHYSDPVFDPVMCES